MLRVWILILLFTFQAYGKDFGKQGATFPIVEEGLIQMIKRKLSRVDITQHQQLMQKRARKAVETPQGFYLPRASKDQSYLVDPTFELKEDIRLPGGRVLFDKGTKINPLEHTPLDKKIILLDAEDKEQVKWLKNKNIDLNDLIILTNGSPIFLSKAIKRPVYFDQHKQFVNKFDIKHLPAVVAQENNLIRVLICQI